MDIYYRFHGKTFMIKLLLSITGAHDNNRKLYTNALAL